MVPELLWGRWMEGSMESWVRWWSGEKWGKWSSSGGYKVLMMVMIDVVWCGYRGVMVLMLAVTARWREATAGGRLVKWPEIGRKIWMRRNSFRCDKMADENVPAPAPTQSDDQILPFAAWVPVGKSNFVLDLNKKQKNPIFQISENIPQNTNFFRAFTASASLDETRFVLNANLLRDALEITPVDQAYQFVSPPSGDATIDFVNQLEYTEIIHFVSRMTVNNLYQPWRAILSMINQCLTGKTSGHDRPRYPTFLTDKANMGSPTKKGWKDKHHVIPYCRFTKIIICYLERIHNIHQRLASLFHLVEEDFRLGNFKFVPKGKIDEVFGMPIPDELISNNIKNAPYYNAYLEMVAKHDRKVAAEKEGKKKTASAKQSKSKPAVEKSSNPTPAPKPKTTKERPSKLVDEPYEEPSHYEPEPELEHQGEGDEDDMERAIQMSLESFQAQSQAHVGGVAIREPVVEATRPLVVVEGKGKAIAAEEQAKHSLLTLHTPKRRSTMDQFVLQRWTPVIKEASTGPSAQAQDDTSVNIVRDSPSPADVETKTCVASEKTNSRKEPLSSSGTLSSMKNLDDAYTIGDQFMNDKSTEDEPGKLNAESEVVYMVTVLIHQASSSIPTLSTPIIDLSPPKPTSSTKAPIFTATTTNLLLPPPTTTKHVKF
uniref:Histone deacetylase 14 n=1 Tax=Tanacetum cinerariifolium TaxID=118510 RepID=A0A6L2MXR6_TANCI|nr:hypothetical protein [Tanacetum cinerariifolium]